MTEHLVPFPELAGHVPAVTEHIPDLSPVDAGRGLTAELFDLEELVRDDLRLEAVAVRAGLGLQVERHLGHPSVFVLSTVAQLSISRGSEVALAEHGGVIAVDLLRLDRPALLRTSDRYFVLERRGTGLDVQAFTPDTGQHPAPKLDSPVESWVTGDPWLARSVAARLASGDPFDQFVAVGLAWRLLRRDPAAERELASRLVAGRPDREDARERSWARSVSPPAWRWVEQRALLGIASLRERLDKLVDAPSPRATLEVCHERDALEGVALALQAGRSSESLDRALAEIDVLGSATLGALAPMRLDDDEQLRRAAALDPTAWWVQPARPGRSA